MWISLIYSLALPPLDSAPLVIVSGCARRPHAPVPGAGRIATPRRGALNHCRHPREHGPGALEWRNHDALASWKVRAACSRAWDDDADREEDRSEEHTSELSH